MPNDVIAIGFNKKNGRITQMGIPPIETDTFIEVPYSVGKPLLDKSVPLNKYRVLYSTEEKRFELTNVGDIKNTVFDIRSYHYEIPKTDDECDLIIEQDLKNSVWRISISKELQNNLKDTTINETIDFSITELGDINILYRLLRINFVELMNSGTIDVKFITEEESNSIPLSIYTAKKLQTYGYKVLV